MAAFERRFGDLFGGTLTHELRTSVADGRLTEEARTRILRGLGHVT